MTWGVGIGIGIIITLRTCSISQSARKKCSCRAISDEGLISFSFETLLTIDKTLHGFPFLHILSRPCLFKRLLDEVGRLCVQRPVSVHWQLRKSRWNQSDRTSLMLVAMCTLIAVPALEATYFVSPFLARSSWVYQCS